MYAQQRMQSHHRNTTSHSHQHTLQSLWYCPTRNQETHNSWEWNVETNLDSKHPLKPHRPVPRRLKSRKCFATVEGFPAQVPAQYYRKDHWTDFDGRLPPNKAVEDPTEEITDGALLLRCDMCASKRVRDGVARTGDNLVRWAIKTYHSTEFKENTQTINHILHSCPLSHILYNSWFSYCMWKTTPAVGCLE